jgi:DNA transposition AAA+ family ATPase
MNRSTTDTIAPLTNVMLADAAVEAAVNRPAHLPGLVTLYGPSGWGKTQAAVYAANKHRAYYCEARSGWTRKAMLLAVLRDMGVTPAHTVYEMTDQVSDQLARSRRPLIVDEIDHLIDRRAIETIRDIHEGAGVAILMIGEERVPTKLKSWERFHGRMLDWVAAQPPSLEDARQLRRLYCRDVKVKDDLLALIYERAQHSVRRICVNLERAASVARDQGLEEIGLEAWGERPLFTGDPPPRRV